MINSDLPITQQSQDILQRSPFACRLGDAVLNWHKNESIVIALYGPWGNGKTSVLNLAIEHIQQNSQNHQINEKPIIVWFNPLSIAGSLGSSANSVRLSRNKLEWQAILSLEGCHASRVILTQYPIVEF